MGIGKIMTCQVTVCITGKTEGVTKASILKTKSMVMACICGRTDGRTAGGGRRANSTDWASTATRPRRRSSSDSGSTVAVSSGSIRKPSSKLIMGNTEKTG